MITIRNHTTSFDLGVVSKMSFEQFESMCEGIITFAQLPVKERKAKIKEVYGNIKRDVKQDEKPKSGKDSHASDKQPVRGDIGAESKADDGGEDVGGKEDKAKIQKRVLRKEETKTKL